MNFQPACLVIALTCVFCHYVSANTSDGNSTVLRIVTVLSRPFVMLKPNAQNLTGNEMFEGYLIDLMEAISELTGYKHDIQLQSERIYGRYDEEEKRWTGMVGDLLSKRADLALADLTITLERQRMIDFSVSYMNSGVGILYVKPKIKDPDLFSFLHPLSSSVWICVVFAYLLVSLCLYLLAKISPSKEGSLDGIASRESLTLNGPPSSRSFEGPNHDSEQKKRSEMKKQPKTSLASRASNAWKSLSSENESEGQNFTLKNSFWFVTASMLQQGNDVLPPRNGSTQLVTGLWWIFTLILVSSYTANLAAHLTVKRMESPIFSAEDLSKQDKIKYGTYAFGSTKNFFQNSKLPVYNRMWNFMKSDKSNFITDGNQAGVDRVIRENGNYAYLMEQGALEYAIERNCDLTQIGRLLNDRNYGIAMPPNSPHRKKINEAILTIQEQGSLQLFKKRWWQDFENYQQCSKGVSTDTTAESLDVKNIGGLFILLVSGLCLAIVVAFVERHFQKRHEIVI